jgi:hypothetical protein
MSTETHKAAFAAAAAAAREMMAGKAEKRAHLARQLEAIDAEIARLQVVIDFDAAEPVRKHDANPMVARPKKHDWVAAIGAVLVQFPQGLTYNDLVEQLRTAHGFDHSKAHILRLLETGEKKGALRKDEERRWHIVKNAPRANGARKTPWHALPGANV